MKNILIVDAGSTKTSWSFLLEESDEFIRLKTDGINPALDSENTIRRTFQTIHQQLPDVKIKDIYFFGSGCATQILKNIIESTLKDVFQSDIVNVESDLIGASIALFGDETGIACILGTGSASALISNGKIQSQTPSLGYILGDEGSGVALGKRLINSIFKRQLSEKIILSFQKKYKLGTEELINNVYKSPKPSAYIASFSPFLLENVKDSEIYDLIENEFENFFLKNIIPYGNIKHLKFGMVGSVAWCYKDILIKCALEKFGLIIDRIIKDPLPELEKYYLNKRKG